MDKIILTEESIAATLALRATKPEWQDKDLRVYIAGKGCDGFTYGVSFDDAAESDLHFEVCEGLSIIVDQEGYTFLEGSIVTWVDDERGRGFLVENPKHKSYRGKFYKRPVWREKLQAKKTEAAVVTTQQD